MGKAGNQATRERGNKRKKKSSHCAGRNASTWLTQGSGLGIRDGAREQQVAVGRTACISRRTNALESTQVVTRSLSLHSIAVPGSSQWLPSAGAVYPIILTWLKGACT